MAQKTASKSGGKARSSVRSTKKAGATRTAKPRSTRRRGADAAPPAGEEAVSIDRRRRGRRQEVASEEASPAVPPMERRKKVNRRRQIDPTTCERDYTEPEIEFMNALDDYKHRSGRMFPTCSEVLEVVRGLGYVKLSPAEIGQFDAAENNDASATALPNEPADPNAGPQSEESGLGVVE